MQLYFIIVELEKQSNIVFPTSNEFLFWENKQYKVWHQDKQTFEGKIDIINQNNFRGFSAWVLGVEDPQIWSTISLEK